VPQLALAVHVTAVPSIVVVPDGMTAVSAIGSDATVTTSASR
jgi:hypothetical protein